MAQKGWVGIDLDATLARYDGWVDETHIGEPIPAMVEIAKAWMANNVEVRIMTARVTPQAGGGHIAVKKAIQDWTEKHLGVRLEVTNQKDYRMILLYDDRAVQVEPNTGKILGIDPLAA